jgi:chromosome segregation ATPase
MAAQDEQEPVLDLILVSPGRNAAQRSWRDLTDTMAEWTDTVELADSAVDRVRLAEQRSSEAEQRLRDAEARLGQEITGLQVRLRAAEQTIERLEAARFEAEAQARASTERADSAEKYLMRITEVMRPVAPDVPPGKER